MDSYTRHFKAIYRTANAKQHTQEPTKEYYGRPMEASDLPDLVSIAYEAMVDCSSIASALEEMGQHFNPDTASALNRLAGEVYSATSTMSHAQQVIQALQSRGDFQ